MAEKLTIKQSTVSAKETWSEQATELDFFRAYDGRVEVHVNTQRWYPSDAVREHDVFIELSPEFADTLLDWLQSTKISQE